jgi:RNA polymerase sigma-70 factor (ECF subfamily)
MTAMRDTPDPLDAASLLAHVGWLRRLARSLTLDEASAEDAVHQTWVRVLEHPPSREGALRGWLARVLRNEVLQRRRGDGMRQGRERRAAALRDASVPPAATLVQRAELHRRLTAHVLALEEPYRETILLRYYEELEPAEIAQRQGAPGSTVRAQLKRGLAQLRARLDADRGTSWRPSLLLLASRDGGSTVSATVTGVLAMSFRAKVLLGCAVLLAGAGGIVWLKDLGTERSGPGATLESPVTATADSEGPGVEIKPVSTVPFSEPARSPGPAKTSPPDERLLIRLRFVDWDGIALSLPDAERRFAGGVVRLLPEALLAGGSMQDRLQNLVSPPPAVGRDLPVQWTDGGAEVHADAEPGRFRLAAVRPGRAPTLSGPFAAGRDRVPEVTLTLPADVPHRRIRLVEKASGSPVPGARVTPFFEFGDDQLFVAGSPLVADAEGEALLPIPDSPGGKRDPDSGRGATWWAETTTLAAEISPFHLRDGEPGSTTEIPMTARGNVLGQAWLPSGEPAGGREVLWFRKGLIIRAKVAADGRFVVQGIPSGRRWVGLVRDIAEMDFESRAVDLEPGSTAEVTFGSYLEAGRRSTLEGRITFGGLPAEGMPVIIRGEEGQELSSRSDADGLFRIEGIRPGRSSVGVLLGDLRVADDFRIDGRLELNGSATRRLDLDLPDGVFRVKLVDTVTGVPVPGAGVMGRPDDAVEQDRFPGLRYRPGWAAFADEEGRALLRAMVPGVSHTVSVQAPGYEEAEVRAGMPGTVGHPAEVTIRVARRP